MSDRTADSSRYARARVTRDLDVAHALRWFRARHEPATQAVDDAPMGDILADSGIGMRSPHAVTANSLGAIGFSPQRRALGDANDPSVEIGPSR